MELPISNADSSLASNRIRFFLLLNPLLKKFPQQRAVNTESSLTRKAYYIPTAVALILAIITVPTEASEEGSRVLPTETLTDSTDLE